MEFSGHVTLATARPGSSALCHISVFATFHFVLLLVEESPAASAGNNDNGRTKPIALASGWLAEVPAHKSGSLIVEGAVNILRDSMAWSNERGLLYVVQTNDARRHGRLCDSSGASI